MVLILLHVVNITTLSDHTGKNVIRQTERVIVDKGVPEKILRVWFGKLKSPYFVRAF